MRLSDAPRMTNFEHEVSMLSEPAAPGTSVTACV